MFGPLIGKPASARQTKTGAWRTGSKPKFLQNNCIACKLCLLVCPEGCVSGGEKNTYNCEYDYCKGCGICASLCPKKDIEIVKEEAK